MLVAQTTRPVQKSWLRDELWSFPFFLPLPNPNRPCLSERSPKAHDEANSVEPPEWSERLTSGQLGWPGAATIGLVPALALSHAQKKHVITGKLLNSTI